jgi:hypothetical protein
MSYYFCCDLWLLFSSNFLLFLHFWIRWYSEHGSGSWRHLNADPNHWDKHLNEYISNLNSVIVVVIPVSSSHSRGMHFEVFFLV